MYNQHTPSRNSPGGDYIEPPTTTRDNLRASLEILEKQLTSTDAQIMALEDRLGWALIPNTPEAYPKEPEPMGGSDVRHLVDCLAGRVQSINRKISQIISRIDL